MTAMVTSLGKDTSLKELCFEAEDVTGLFPWLEEFPEETVDSDEYDTDLEDGKVDRENY